MLNFYKFRKNIWLNFYIVVEYNNKGAKFMEQYIFPAVFFQEEGEDLGSSLRCLFSAACQAQAQGCYQN